MFECTANPGPYRRARRRAGALGNCRVAVKWLKKADAFPSRFWDLSALAHSPVTACIPAFNAERFVADTIDSILAQTVADLRVAISVDLSADGTAAQCRRFAQDPRVDLVVQERRLGYLGNIEFLLARVRTPFAFIMPHDDLIAPDYAATLLGLLERDAGAVLAYCDINRFGLEKTPFRRPPAEGTRLQQVATALRCHVGAVAFRGLIRMEALDRAPRLPSNGHDDFAADTAFLLELLTRGRFAHTPQLLYDKRVHAGSQNRSWMAHDPAWQSAAWLEHCTVCARIVLDAFDNEHERATLADALCDRLLMTDAGLWPPADTASLPRADRQSLLSQFAERLRGIAVDGAAVQGVERRLRALERESVAS